MVYFRRLAIIGGLGIQTFVMPATAGSGPFGIWAMSNGKVTVQVDSLFAIDQVVIGLADAPPITKRLKAPAQHVEVELTVPRHLKQGTTISVQAEARGAALLQPLRASSLLLVGDPKQPIVLP